MCIIHFSSVYDEALAPDHRGENTVGRYRCPALHCTCRNERGVYLSETTYLSSRCADTVFEPASCFPNLESMRTVRWGLRLLEQCMCARFSCCWTFKRLAAACCASADPCERPGRALGDFPPLVFASSLSVFCGCCCPSRASS